MADNLEWAVRLLEVLDLLVAQLDAHTRCTKLNTISAYITGS